MGRALYRISVTCFPDAESFVRGAAEDLANRIQSTVEERGNCRIAISGGSTPLPVYQELSRPAFGYIDWARVDVFWADERCVPRDHPASNYAMAKAALLSHVPIAAEHVHRIRGERRPQTEAHRYSAVLGEQALDIVVLGMGADGHVASLFPGGRESPDDTNRVIHSIAPAPPYHRISLALRTMNESQTVCFWVTGHHKAERVAQVFREYKTGTLHSPAARVTPRRNVVWLLDDAAAEKLPEIDQQRSN